MDYKSPCALGHKGIWRVERNRRDTKKAVSVVAQKYIQERKARKKEKERKNRKHL
jgi:hypothetical protein